MCLLYVCSTFYVGKSTWNIVVSWCSHRTSFVASSTILMAYNWCQVTGGSPALDKRPVSSWMMPWKKNIGAYFFFFIQCILRDQRSQMKQYTFLDARISMQKPFFPLNTRAWLHSVQKTKTVNTFDLRSSETEAHIIFIRKGKKEEKSPISFLPSFFSSEVGLRIEFPLPTGLEVFTRVSFAMEPSGTRLIRTSHGHYTEGGD